MRDKKGYCGVDVDCDLGRFKARKKEIEVLYIFFGLHTANLVHMAERLTEQELAIAA